MKILHRFLIKSFLGPFFLTFFIVLFILVMQFLWKYVDDMVGKGLPWYTILELLFYASASLVPLALPLAVLLSSIMTFGNLGEFNELTAIKSAGVSLKKLLFPLAMLMIFLAGLAFYFSNVLLPIANLKFGALLYDIREQKPSMQIKPGVFYNGIEGYSIKVGSKNIETNELFDLVIYNHTAGRGNVQLIKAKAGTMEVSPNGHYMRLSLTNGKSYEEMLDGSSGKFKPHNVTTFEEQEVFFDLSGFKLNRTDEKLFKDHHAMLNVFQLNKGIDSLNGNLYKRAFEIAGFINQYYTVLKDTQEYAQLPQVQLPVSSTHLDSFSAQTKIAILQESITNIQSLRGYTELLRVDVEVKSQTIRRYFVEWHRKFTLSIAVLVLFLVGAPLGAIVRKGGLGMPMVLSIGGFLIYHITSMIGEKMVVEGQIQPASGMWLSTAVLLPIGVFLMVKANNDSKLFEFDTYKKLFLRSKQHK